MIFLQIMDLMQFRFKNFQKILDLINRDFIIISVIVRGIVQN
jgi:hypothetical protein